MQKESPRDDLQEGHRARIIESYSKIDLKDLSPHQVLEYILFYVYPRGDVNPIANGLLEKFGSVQNVLEAGPTSLKQVAGINDRAAKMISGFARIFDFYTNCKLEKKTTLSNWADVYDACESLVRFQNREMLYIIGLDEKFTIIANRKLGSGSAATVASSANLIFDFINETKSVNIILTHNHPNGICTPSILDKTNNEKLKNYITVMGAKFVDHIIVGSDGVYSLLFNKKVRSFTQLEDVRHLAKIYSGKDD